MTRLEKWRKDYSTFYNYSSLKCLTGRTKLSHVVGVEVLQIYYLFSMPAVYSVSTAALKRRLFFLSLNSVPCVTVRAKGLREFKQGLVSYSGEEHKGKLNYK